MNKSYWARFYEDSEGRGFTVDVPDLPGCITEGATWDEAYYMAQDAVRGWLQDELDDNREPPEARDPAAVAAAESFEGAGQPCLVLVTVSLKPSSDSSLLPDGLWADLAKASRKEGLPVNEILALAAREYLARHQSHG
jgi:predicted RNase H-like HicB family nuclease